MKILRDNDVRALAVRTVLALLGALVVGGIAIAVAGLDPIASYQAIVENAVGSTFAIKNSLVQALPLTLTALGVAIAYRAGLFNLGGEGQIYMGALGAVGAALLFPDAPAAVMIPAALLCGMLAGGFWGGIAGALRARLGLSELIVTIMLNFIAFWIVSYLVRHPLQDPGGAGYPQTDTISAAFRLGTIADTIPVGAIVLVLAVAAVWVLLERSRAGLELKDIGDGESAARFAGIPVERRLLLAMVLAGVLGGLGGAVELTGNQYRLSDFFTPGWGYAAIAVALIGRGTALGTLGAGLLIGALRSGIDGAQGVAGIPESIAEIVQGTAVLFLLIANADVVVAAMRKATRRRAHRNEQRTLDEQPA